MVLVLTIACMYQCGCICTGLEMLSKFSSNTLILLRGVLCIMLTKQLRESPQGRSALNLLIKQKEEAVIEDKMRQKQQEFSARMENCFLRRNQLKKKKARLEGHIESFRCILQDSEIRKFRAAQKTNSESKELSLRVQEADALSRDLDRSNARKYKTINKIAKYSRVALFMEGVHAVAPQGHLDENLPPCEAVVSRYHTLVHAKKYIQNKSNGKVQEMEVLQGVQIARKTGHTNKVMGLATSLANLKSQLESLSERNLTMQEAIDKKMEAYQQEHQTLFMVLNTIDNISESCKQYSTKPIKEDKTSPAESKLKHIQEFCIHWSEVVAHILHQWDES